MTVNQNPEKGNSYNFNVVSKEAVNYFRKAFGGREQITSTELANESKKPIHIKKPLDALNILYAMCAAGQAKIDRRFKGQSLYFNVRSNK